MILSRTCLIRTATRKRRAVFAEELLAQVPAAKREALRGILAQDPRPSYQNDPERIYGVAFGRQNIRFRVSGSVLTVCEVQEYTGAREKDGRFKPGEG